MYSLTQSTLCRLVEYYSEIHEYFAWLAEFPTEHEVYLHNTFNINQVMALMTTGRLSPFISQRDVFTLFIGGYAEDFQHERNIIHTKVKFLLCVHTCVCVCVFECMCMAISNAHVLCNPDLEIEYMTCRWCTIRHLSTYYVLTQRTILTRYCRKYAGGALTRELNSTPST